MRQGSEALTVYLEDIARYPLIDSATEQALATEIEFAESMGGHGFPERGRLVSSNLRLVVHIAKDYSAKLHRDMEDLIGDGNLGLVRAAELFRTNIGTFSTFAVPWIHQSIRQQHIRRSKSIKVPRYALDKAKEYEDAFDALRLLNSDRHILREDILESLGAKRKAAIRSYVESYSASKLLVFQENSWDYRESLDQFPDRRTLEDDSYKAQQLIALILVKLERLSSRDRTIIRMKYGLDPFEEARTIKEIAREVNMSSTAITTIVRRTLDRLHEQLGDDPEPRKLGHRTRYRR